MSPTADAVARKPFWIPDQAIDTIHGSPLNPRKTFAEAPLAELADSIKTDAGIIEPIVVRVVDGRYEIVAGERRWRAAKLAGLTTVPVIVRALTDAQALKIMVLENDQREDLNAFERAQGYAELMKVDPECADRKHLAQELGRSVSWVHAALRVLSLIPAAQAALGAGALTESHALEIARLEPESQKLALAACALDHPAGKATLSVRDLKRFIAEDIHRDLKAAPFAIADAELVVKAGPCTTCPKRAGNAPDLFADVKKPDTCTDRGCYQGKVQAHLHRRIAELSTPQEPAVLVTQAYFVDSDAKKALGRPVLTGDEWRDIGNGKSVELKDSCQHTRSAIVVSDRGTIRGETCVCIKRDCPVHAPAGRASTARSAPSKAEKAQRDAAKVKEQRRTLDAKARVEVAGAIGDAIAAAFPSALAGADLRDVARAMFFRLGSDSQGQLGVLLGWSDELVSKDVDGATDAELVRFLLIASLLPAIAKGNEFFTPDAKPLFEMAKRWKVDAAAILKAVAAGGTRSALKPTPKALALDKEALDAFGAASSLDRFGATGKKLVVKSVEHDGLLYTVVGSVSQHGGYLQVDAHRLHLRAAWPFPKVKPRAYSSSGGYGGVIAFTHGDEYVLDPVCTRVTPVKAAQTSAPKGAKKAAKKR